MPTSTLQVAATAPWRPVLLHCAAGKDRTGIAVGLLLGIVGVDPDEIVAITSPPTTT